MQNINSPHPRGNSFTCPKSSGGKLSHRASEGDTTTAKLSVVFRTCGCSGWQITHSRGFVLYQRHLATERTLSRWGQWPRTPKRVEGEEVRSSSSTQFLKKGLQESGLLKTAQPKQPKVLWASYLCPRT